MHFVYYALRSTYFSSTRYLFESGYVLSRAPISEAHCAALGDNGFLSVLLSIQRNALRLLRPTIHLLGYV